MRKQSDEGQIIDLYSTWPSCLDTGQVLNMRLWIRVKEENGRHVSWEVLSSPNEARTSLCPDIKKTVHDVDHQFPMNKNSFMQIRTKYSCSIPYKVSDGNRREKFAQNVLKDAIFMIELLKEDRQNNENVATRIPFTCLKTPTQHHWERINPFLSPNKVTVRYEHFEICTL